MIRLKRQHDFDYVFSKGKRVYARSLCMIYVKKPVDTLIGISVSKKHGNAVTRNRIKRLLRAVYYPIYDRIKKGYLIIFVPKVSDDYFYETFSRDTLYLLSKENMIDDAQ